MASAMKPSTAPSNYFTCTLGEANGKTLDLSDIQTVTDFIDHRANTSPKAPAVGFPVAANEDDNWTFDILNFEELRNGSAVIAEVIRSVLVSKDTSSSDCVALLCPSSFDFLFAWLGLMRAGYSVLLIAPQCPPAAMVHLCKSCDASILFHDKAFTDLASKAASEADSKLVPILLPWQARNISVTSIARQAKASSNIQQETRNTLAPAFIFHTSGTSLGLPKPIIQSHRAAFKVLPVLDGQRSATFTTTPLYHGGIADCFRAWTSGALIWLFPAADVPITTRNILSSLSAATKASLKASTPQVKYFSSVPYILQMLAEDSDGLSALQSMELVGVGGAALNPVTGNRLVDMGVNLVSRFGSAECGFLLSSHREYSTDRDWQYLRVSPQSDSLCFEEQDDDSGLSELIVKKGWPHIAKSNRKDGSSATSDLFEPHPKIEGAWKYHSRSDSQITLSTGKKFDPAPLEDLIISSSPIIREVLIFGSNRLKPGLLIFPSNQAFSMSTSALEEESWKVVKAINSKGPSHARIDRDALLIMTGIPKPLERSSKGTLLRAPLETRFARYIDWVYTRDAAETNGDIVHEPECIKAFVRKTVADVLGMDDIFNDDADLYSNGIDSAACLRIRSLLQKHLVRTQDPLPWNVVYDCRNINSLSQFITEFRDGKTQTKTSGTAEMLELVKKFSTFSIENQVFKESTRPSDASSVVLLTGATGALGAHILDDLCKSSSTSLIICLVRAVDPEAARSRVSASLLKRQKKPLEPSDRKVCCVPCKLNDPRIGLSEANLSYVRREVTHIIHAAWAVNFSLPLKSFVQEHITGIHHLLNLTHSCTKPVKFTFCSSTASVLGPNHPSTIPEQTSSDPADAGLIGYSQSKWVAEAICTAASATLPDGAVNILRIGQCTGDTENGIWNVSEAWPLMLSTAGDLHCLPRIEGESLKWLPLNIAATAVLEIALSTSTGTSQDGKNKGGAKPRVYHLVNNSTPTPTWWDLVTWSSDATLEPFEIVAPEVWLDRLERFEGDQPAKRLLGFWRAAYGGEKRERDLGDDDDRIREGIPTTTLFSTGEAEGISEAMRGVAPVSRELVFKIWEWVEEEFGGAD